MNLNVALGDVVSVFFVLAIAVFIFRNNKAESEKRKDIYNKIERSKKDAEEKFVETKVCKVLHRELKDDIGEIKKKTECIPKIKVGVDLLLQKNGLKTDD